jgi:hypothetical protein
MARRVGQTEAVSLVIISGIVITLVGAAYFWGMPLIDKRSANTAFDSARSEITDISKKIVSLANAGGGRTEVQLSKALTLIPAEASSTDNNTLILTYGVNQPMLYPGAEGAVVYIGATLGDLSQDVGTFGQSSPGIITVRQNTTSTGSYLLTTRLKFRYLATSGATQKHYIIKLCSDTDSGCTQRITGTSSATFIFKGTEVVQGTVDGIATDIVVTKIGVRLS